MSLWIVTGYMVAGLVLWVLTGGADFGAGTWDLLAGGRTKKEQRAIIDDALSPIWEANHVWLIVVVTVLFAGFPSAFAAVATALHVPILFLLLGVVLRGAAFSFRAHDPDEASRKRWGVLFSIGSVIAPAAAGVIVGALTSGEIRFEGDGRPVGGFFWPWISTWTALVGAFAVAAFSWLAAVYLCVEASTRKSEAVRAFHSRAIVSFGALTLLAWMLLASSKIHAPAVWEALIERREAWPIHVTTAVASIIALDGVIRERYRRARLFAAIQVSTIVIGWASAQAPCIIVPSITVANSASPARTLSLLAGALIVGSLLLLPSLAFLYKSFKGELPLWPFEPRR